MTIILITRIYSRLKNYKVNYIKSYYTTVTSCSTISTTIQNLWRFMSKKMSTTTAYNGINNESDEIVFRGPTSTCLKLDKGLGHLIFKHLDINRDAIFQIDPDTDIRQSRGEIKTRSVRVAIELQRLGLKTGDILTICTRNHLNTALPFLAAIYLGVTVNVVHEIFNKNELSRILSLVKPKMILCDENVRGKFTEIIKEINLTETTIHICDNDFEKNFLKESKDENKFQPVEIHDVHNTNALILCSSGTTGLMKGIPHTHYTFYHAVYDTAFVANKNDIILTFSPLVWNSSSWIILYCILSGAIRVAATWRNPTYAMELIDKYKITYLNSNPSKVYELATSDDLEKFAQIKNTLRVIWSRGSPNTKEQMQLYRAKFPNTHVMNAIGCTEMMMMIAFFDPQTEWELNRRKVDSVGKLCPGVTAKVIDLETGKCLGTNQKGELLLKAECMMKGYYQNPEANEKAFTKDGWYHTGDIAYFDDDECLYIVGRMKEMIKYNTITISPTEVEFIINQHPGVKTSCVVGIPHPVHGDLPLAFVVRKPNSQITENDIIEVVKKNGADHQQLRGGVIFLDTMPMTATGKVRRSELQKLIENRKS